MFLELAMMAALGGHGEGAAVARADAEGALRLREAAPELAAMPEVTLEAYLVGGRNPRAIRAAMNAVRPAETDGGERFDAVTRWRYSTRWRGRGDVRCVPETAEAVVAITVILPDLAEADRLGRRDREAWDRYFKALATHEMNHARIALHGRQEIEKAMKAASGCEDMQAAVARVSEEVSAASREYDRLTQHGKREGTVFP